jgi:phosphate transport system ATP-binding protein
VTVGAGHDGSEGTQSVKDSAAVPDSEIADAGGEAAVTDSEATATRSDADMALTASEVNAWFGSSQVLKNEHMTAKVHSVTAIIGPSGSGKSTFIRCLNRMHEEIRGAKVNGNVMFQGTNIYAPHVDPADVRRRIGMVFQRPTPFPTMSILDNAVAGLKLGARYAKAELHKRGEEALRKAGLWDEVKDRLNQPGGGLSGGQQQRLCIARALAVEPHLLLMDEPASALDPTSTLRIEELIQQVKERYTVIIVTHNMQQAARVADETMFMLDGEVVEQGPTDKIFKHPDDERTQDYILGRFG